MIATAARLSVHDLGSGPTVLLVHGWMCDRRDVAALAEQLRSTDHRVLVADLRGHGDNRALPGSFTLTEFAADLAEVLRRHRGGPAVVAGHSMGGAVAIELARTAPDLVAGVVAIDAPWIVTAPDRAALLPSGHLTAREHGSRGCRIVAARRTLHGEGVAIAPPTLEVAAGSFASLMDWDGPGALASVRCPVVALAADASATATRRGAVRHPHVRVEPVTGTGHWIQVEAPDVVAAHIGSLVREVVA